MKNLFLTLIAISFISCTEKPETETAPPASPAQQGVQNPNQPCETNCEPVYLELCQSLTQEEAKCRKTKTENDCKGFVLAFQKVLPKNLECSNTCDQKTFPMAITHGCDLLDKGDYPKITERSAYLLSELNYPMARSVFLSKEFYEILDGALAEGIIPKIEKLKK